MRYIALWMAITLVHDSPSGWTYPLECCEYKVHCHPVPCDQLVETDKGWTYLPTGHVFLTERVRPSGDRDCHVCTNGANALCAFILNGA